MNGRLCISNTINIDLFDPKAFLQTMESASFFAMLVYQDVYLHDMTLCLTDLPL